MAQPVADGAQAATVTPGGDTTTAPRCMPIRHLSGTMRGAMSVTTAMVPAAVPAAPGPDAAPRIVVVSDTAIYSPLRHLDPTRVSAAAKAESRNREVHLPPVSAYRWWARRTEAVNGAIIDAVATDKPGRLLIADVFAGGGVIPLAGVIRGHRVYAQDLNPWAATGLATMLGLPPADGIRDAAASLEQWLHTDIQAAYGTTLADGTTGVVSHTFRVATGECTACGQRARMFPHALVSLLTRRERGGTDAFLACPGGHLFRADASGRRRCPTCRRLVDPAANYTPRRLIGCSCGHVDRLEDRAGTWEWEVVLVERTAPGRRELALPTAAEIAAAESPAWQPERSLGAIPAGQETRVLLRHGFTHWEDLYPRRQRAILERLLDRADHCSEDPAVVRAVTMAIVGSAEMAGHLSRWDRFYLKSYESMAGHRFNLTTLAVEPNAWGSAVAGRGTVLRRLGQLVKAATWMHDRTGRELTVDARAATDVAPGAEPDMTDDVRVVEGSSEHVLLPEGVADLAQTDPPYHDDVQYAELSLPLRAWAGLSAADLTGEAVVNDATGQLADEGAYQALLTRIFAENRRVLRADGHLVFSYANRDPHAWVALFNALQAAGLRAVGCEIVHSENETDQAKRGVRACALDLIMDLAPAGDAVVVQHLPRAKDRGDEASFLRRVADAFLRTGQLAPGWAESFVTELRTTPFLSS